ncbi:hypothetical protein CLV93_10850 [Prolixibacter denitrificans]|uniref:Uncharacterized protein n=1 Tax=Prolixibacter denitrificans TaxID=1541063 RepID=A0A2P8C9M1_9BACT|nr:hypothetical protein CLV93_10850 [Prolixibacter denitrificans]GET21176.1 hypothetical protein JCM18694_14220 [Prolixibacter denitrificans]
MKKQVTLWLIIPLNTKAHPEDTFIFSVKGDKKYPSYIPKPQNILMSIIQFPSKFKRFTDIIIIFGELNQITQNYPDKSSPRQHSNVHHTIST